MTLHSVFSRLKTTGAGGAEDSNGEQNRGTHHRTSQITLGLRHLQELAPLLCCSTAKPCSKTTD